jgi:hypothetical protein
MTEEPMPSARQVPMFASAVLLVGTALVGGSSGAGAAASGGGGAVITSRVIHGGQTTRLGGTPSVGETAPDVGPEAATIKTPVANRSLSSKARANRAGAGLSGIPAANTPIQTASSATSFAGINHHQQRFEIAGGNQWSLEPPDQALCVGGGFVLEAVNNAVAVYRTSGTRLALKPSHRAGWPEADHRPDVPVRSRDRSVLPDDPHLLLGHVRQSAAVRHQHP